MAKKYRKYICFSLGNGQFRGVMFPDEEMFKHSAMWEAVRRLKVTEGKNFKKPLRSSECEVIGAGFYDPERHMCFGESYSLGVESNGEQDLNILFQDKEY